MLNAFFEHLDTPVCLVSHNGNKFDFPLLKSELSRNNFNLSKDILCCDSCIALRAVDKLEGVPQRSVDYGGYDRFHNINAASEKLSSGNVRRNEEHVVKQSHTVTSNVPPVGPYVFYNMSATPNLELPKSYVPPALKRKHKDCGCNPPHGNTELDACFSAKRRLIFPHGNDDNHETESVSPCNFECDVTSTVNTVKRNLFGSDKKSVRFNNGEHTPVKNLDDSLNGIEVIEGVTPPSDCLVVHGSMAEQILQCDENLDTPEKASDDELADCFEDYITDDELIKAVDSTEKIDSIISNENTPNSDIVSSVTNSVERNQVPQMNPGRRALFNNKHDSSKNVLVEPTQCKQSWTDIREQFRNPVHLFGCTPQSTSAPSISNMGTSQQTIVSSTLKPQNGNNKTAVPSTPPRSGYKDESGARPLACKKSYKLSKIHRRVVGIELEDAHCAEVDSIGLLRIFQKSSPLLFEWIDTHAVPFSDVISLPVNTKVPLDKGAFPYQVDV